MKTLRLMIPVLLISVAAFAATYSNSNLNGTYSVQTTQPSYDVWSKTFTCPYNSKTAYTASGSTTAQEVSYGTVNFDGNGNYSASLTLIGEYNPTASANTLNVQWNSSCNVTRVNNGYIVYAAPTQESDTGTYTVQSDGVGSLTVPGQSTPVNFQLAATDNTGTSNTVLLYNPTANQHISGAGIAVHQ